MKLEEFEGNERISSERVHLEKKGRRCLERNEGQTYLHFAAYLGDVDATKMLIEDNAEVNAVDDDKWTALHLAAEKGHVDVAKVLIQNGADVNAVDERQMDGTSLRSSEGHVDVVKVLIQNGADVNAVHKDN